MSPIITPVAQLDEPPGGLGEQVARLIEPEVWEAFEAKAKRKGWGPAERRMELVEEIKTGRRLASSCTRARAILALIADLPPVLTLGVEAVAASAVLISRCPICLTANPCARHSYAQQIRALDDPEYLESVVPPCDLGEGQRP